jgi:cation diffusion facilitator family transporter
MHIGQRVALAGMLVSGALAVVKIWAGLAGHSAAALADGLESGGDVFSSGLVLAAMTLAVKPADAEHPYGHGRAEILTGLLIGLVLTATGALITYGSAIRIGEPREPVSAFVLWPLAGSLVAKSILAGVKFSYSRKLQSDALRADAWNDSMDTLSAIVALSAVGMAVRWPNRFLEADHIGGMVIGLIVVAVGVRVAYDTALQLMDTMPAEAYMNQIREVASTVPGARGVEKCYARKTGLRYHVDLHLEVDSQMTVRQSHEIAHQVQERILERLDWVAAVLVHVEPAP